MVLLQMSDEPYKCLRPLVQITLLEDSCEQVARDLRQGDPAERADVRDGCAIG